MFWVLGNLDFLKKYFFSRKSRKKKFLTSIILLIDPEECPQGKGALQHEPQRLAVKVNDVLKVKRRRCVVCVKRRLRKDTSYFCPECPGQPALCTGCFKVYHAASLLMRRKEKALS